MVFGIPNSGCWTPPPSLPVGRRPAVLSLLRPIGSPKQLAFASLPLFSFPAHDPGTAVKLSRVYRYTGNLTFLHVLAGAKLARTIAMERQAGSHTSLPTDGKN